ncbi:NPTX1 protein, partial [Locustella ochotensis]|nr:NPTX1 protein [Locustella ochotensis]
LPPAPGLHGNGKPGNRLEGGYHGNRPPLPLPGNRYGNHGNHHGAPRGGFRVAFPLRTNYMFARLRGPVRSPLRAVSVCLWLRPGGAPNLGTPFSYAAPGQPNELVLLAWGGRPLELLVDDQ